MIETCDVSIVTCIFISGLSNTSCHIFYWFLVDALLVCCRRWSVADDSYDQKCSTLYVTLCK